MPNPTEFLRARQAESFDTKECRCVSCGREIENPGGARSTAAGLVCKECDEQSRRVGRKLNRRLSDWFNTRVYGGTE